MAVETPRLGLPYPSDRARSWYGDFQSFANALDEALFSALGAPTVILSGGGTLTWDSGAGALTWTDTLVLSAPVAGFQWNLAPGTLTLAEGQYGVVPVTHGTTANVTVVATAAPSLSNLTASLVLCRRVGAGIVFRGGQILPGSRAILATDLFGQALSANELAALRAANAPTGENPLATMADVGGGGGGGGGGGNAEYPLSGGGTKTGAEGGVAEIIGSYYYDPTEHEDAASGVLRVEGWTSDIALVGTVDLYDPLTEETLATVNLTSATEEIPLRGDAALSGLPETATLLRVRASAMNTGNGADVFRVLRVVLLLAGA